MKNEWQQITEEDIQQMKTYINNIQSMFMKMQPVVNCNAEIKYETDGIQQTGEQ